MKDIGSLRKTISGEFDSSKGDLRLAQIYVDKKYFPDFTKVPNLLNELCDKINQKIDFVAGIEKYNKKNDGFSFLF